MVTFPDHISLFIYSPLLNVLVVISSRIREHVICRVEQECVWIDSFEGGVHTRTAAGGIIPRLRGLCRTAKYHYTGRVATPFSVDNQTQCDLKMKSGEEANEVVSLHCCDFYSSRLFSSFCFKWKCIKKQHACQCQNYTKIREDFLFFQFMCLLTAKFVNYYKYCGFTFFARCW